MSLCGSVPSGEEFNGLRIAPPVPQNGVTTNSAEIRSSESQVSSSIVCTVRLCNARRGAIVTACSHKADDCALDRISLICHLSGYRLESLDSAGRTSSYARQKDEKHKFQLESSKTYQYGRRESFDPTFLCYRPYCKLAVSPPLTVPRAPQTP